jgi:hypothetical protein
MNEILEILKYTLPAIVVLITSWIIIKQMVSNDQNRRNQEIIIKNQQTITPVRLQAYERLTLLLERISPEALIMRIGTPKMTAKQLHTELLNQIRAEFDHNVSQQIYVSPQVWEIIKNARTTIIQLINSTAKRVKPDAPAFELSKAILEDVMIQEKSPINLALDLIKKEIRQLY